MDHFRTGDEHRFLIIIPLQEVNFHVVDFQKNAIQSIVKRLFFSSKPSPAINISSSFFKAMNSHWRLIPSVRQKYSKFYFDRSFPFKKQIHPNFELNAFMGVRRINPSRIFTFIADQECKLQSIQSVLSKMHIPE